MNARRWLKEDTRPLHDRAIEALDRFIEGGAYKPGDKLPSEEALAQQLGISRSTLREALGNLEHHGVVVRRHGVGTFVSAPARGHLQGGLEHLETFRTLAAKAGVNEQRGEWRVEVAEAGPETAEALGLSLGAAIVRVQMTALIDQTSFAYLNSFVSAAHVNTEALRAYPDGSFLDYLIEQGEPTITYTRTRLYAIGAEREVAQKLQVAEGKPLLHLVETFFADSGQPVAHTLNYFITDQVDFHLVRRVVGR